jgi:hypothetical protein
MNRDVCDACNATVDMAHPNVDADTPEWIPFDPTRHNCAWCANCHQFINQYFDGTGDDRSQIRSWKSGTFDLDFLERRSGRPQQDPTR